MRHEPDIHEFVRAAAGEPGEVTPLAGDASTRVYYRVAVGDKSFVACYDHTLLETPPDRHPFCVVHGIYRKNRVPVPEIHAIDAGRGLMLLQDLGDVLLEEAVRAMSGDEIKRTYESLLSICVRIQSIDTTSPLPPFRLSFDVEKLMYEFDFFIRHALHGRFNSPLSGSEETELRSEFEKIAALLYRPGLFVLNHRDYHSRNVILQGGSPFVIDFQDSRMGLPHYDLVSLLRDSYTSLGEEIFSHLKNTYYELARERGIHSMGRDEFEFYFDMMAFQRNVKALGTFGYQVTVMKKALYEKYIRPTAGYLGAYAGRRKELRKAGALLARALGEAV